MANCIGDANGITGKRLVTKGLGMIDGKVFFSSDLFYTLVTEQYDRIVFVGNYYKATIVLVDYQVSNLFLS